MNEETDMKTLTALGLIAGITAAPLAMADARLDDAKNAVAMGTDYGIVEFRSIEFDDDHQDDVEIEGWLDDQWYVELEFDDNGNIERESRSRYDRERFGLSADAVLDYLDAAGREGMVWSGLMNSKSAPAATSPSKAMTIGTRSWKLTSAATALSRCG
ncbi:hypothetical protein ASQ50_06525 [Marinobacter sp. LQ44]|nr:hypothetical protein ASQ50_06525 [Marinobacter sp. LQ44]